MAEDFVLTLRRLRADRWRLGRSLLLGALVLAALWSWWAVSARITVRVSSLEARLEVADSSMTDMLALIERIRNEPAPEADLKLAKDFLTGSFPRQIETPQQVAGQVATARLRGLPDDYLETYRERVAAVSAAEVQRVAAEIQAGG